MPRTSLCLERLVVLGRQLVLEALLLEAEERADEDVRLERVPEPCPARRGGLGFRDIYYRRVAN